MKTYINLISLIFLLVSSLGIAQTLTIEERNEKIRERWNRSLVEDENYVFNKEANNLLVNTITSRQSPDGSKPTRPALGCLSYRVFIIVVVH